MAVEVTTRGFKLAALAAMIATGGVLDGAKVVLLKSPISPTDPPATPDDLTVAAAGGYAGAAAATWGTPYAQADGSIVVDCQRINVIATGAGLPESCYGYAFTSADGTILYQARNLDSSLAVRQTGDGYIVDPMFIYQD